MSGPTINWSPAGSRSEPTSARGIRTRERILRAAVSVFERRGFSESTMHDIAEEAGLASGTIYQYFVDKADVFRCLLGELETRLHEETRIHADEDGRFIIVPSVMRYLTLYREYIGLFRVWWELVEPSGEFTSAWVAVHENWRKGILRGLEQSAKDGKLIDGLDPEVVTELIVAMFDRPPFSRIVMGWDKDVGDEDIADLMADLLGTTGLLGK